MIGRAKLVRNTKDDSIFQIQVTSCHWEWSGFLGFMDDYGFFNFIPENLIRVKGNYR